MGIYTLWHVDGVEVFLTGADQQPDPCFVGTITDDRWAGTWVWSATPKPKGLYITFGRAGSSTHGSWTGATWDLGLEVAQGFKQVVGRLKS